jgi:hypothetical protein
MMQKDGGMIYFLVRSNLRWIALSGDIVVRDKDGTIICDRRAKGFRRSMNLFTAWNASR